jgi:hypothetical protein
MLPELYPRAIESNSTGDELPEAKSAAKERLMKAARSGGSDPTDLDCGGSRSSSRGNSSAWQKASYILIALLAVETGFSLKHIQTLAAERGAAERQLSEIRAGHAVQQADLEKIQRNRNQLELAVSDLTQKSQELSGLALHRQLDAEAVRSEEAKWRLKSIELQENVRLLGATIETLKAELKAGRTESEALTGQLGDSRRALAAAEAELVQYRKSRDAERLHIASLESQVADKQREIESIQLISKRDRELLATDRDIRELMGARNLRITDVFDVTSRGKREKAFGRVFFTAGKSLIFYAFDLNQQKDLKAASVFQAWGQKDDQNLPPRSLGVFYVDNATQNRWVLKFDDEETLRQINAVYVTVEPPGGSTNPSGKRLLYAFLNIPPNHP